MGQIKSYPEQTALAAADLFLLQDGSTDITKKVLFSTIRTFMDSISVLLNISESTDVASGTALTAGTWADLTANRNITVANTGSIVVAWANVAMIAGGAAAGNVVSSRFLIDGTTGYTIGGERLQAASQYANPFSGGSFVIITGLTAGVHTIKAQVRSSANGDMFLRALTVPIQEFMTTNVLELRI